MITLAALIYATGIISLDLFLIANRSSLSAGLGPVYPVQLGVAGILTALGGGIAWAGLRDKAGRRAIRIAVRLAGLTLLLYVLLAFVCPFLPNETAIWYDPLAAALAFAWVVWWDSVKAPARPGLRSPS
ncbi:MAG: hypothetical protein JXP34_13385 [Planctomycetes bacterium]|nr:hypothetical protein [Planctomycetota bacterium]